MANTSSQCLICGRSRDHLSVRGTTVHDRITEHDHSRWIDSFVGEHEHLWTPSSRTSREGWFGSTLIACGGRPSLGTLHRMRGELGEEKAQALVLEHVRLLRELPPGEGLKKVDEFLRTGLREADGLRD